MSDLAKGIIILRQDKEMNEIWVKEHFPPRAYDKEMKADGWLETLHGAESRPRLRLTKVPTRSWLGRLATERKRIEKTDAVGLAWQAPPQLLIDDSRGRGYV